eukprot:3448093-Prymnesium_polylepis.1
MPPWILPAHALKTALAHASRVVFSSAGRTYSPGRSSPSSTGPDAIDARWLPREPGVRGLLLRLLRPARRSVAADA